MVERLTPELIRNGGGGLCSVMGGMGAGKTGFMGTFFSELSYAGVKYLIVKPKCAYRPQLHEQFQVSREHILSRSGVRAPATEVDDQGDLSDLHNILANSDVPIVGFEEAHLYDNPKAIANVILQERAKGRWVVVSMLDKDFAGRPFKLAQVLTGQSLITTKRYGYCESKEDGKRCGSKGEYSMRFGETGPANWNEKVKQVGLNYEARCLTHFDVPDRPDDWMLHTSPVWKP